MVVGENITYLDFFLLGLAAYLLVNSLLIGLRESNEKASLFFSIAGFLLSIILFSSNIYLGHLVSQLASLLIWPSLFLFFIFHRKGYSLRWSLLIHFVVPLGWLIIAQSELLSVMGGLFDFVYLLSIIGYGWACIYEASKLRKVALWNSSYLEALFIGLIIVVSSRIILPVFFQDVESYSLYFHIILCGYFIVLSSFYIKAPKKNIEEQMAAIKIDDAINYEEEVKRKLKNAMRRDKAFLDPELSLNDLAGKLGMKSSALSNFINNNLDKNFNDFVNEYRVEEVKQLMLNTSLDPQVTIMELAYQAGFNSKASFNRIFKQFTKMTPTQFKQSNQEIG